MQIDLKQKVYVRPTTEVDLEGVARLWLPRKRDPQTFKWLLSGGGEELRSYVAVAGDKVVGHIAYVMSDYRYKGKTYKGVFTIEWKVDGGDGKQAALSLYSKVLKLGDFTFVIGGTDVVAQIYPHLKFKVPLHVSRFLKVTRPLQYFKALNNNFLKKIPKTVFYSRNLLLPKLPSRNGDVELSAYEGNQPNIANDSVVANELRNDHVQWLMNAPNLTTYPFTIRRNGKAIGMALCYIQNTGGIITGRIVHVSSLGEEVDLWRQVVDKLDNFLVEKGCCVITSMASHPLFEKALRDNRHVFLRKSPFWLRDTKKHFTDAAWHLTYLEGDLAYRQIYISDFVPPKTCLKPRCDVSKLIIPVTGWNILRNLTTDYSDYLGLFL